MKKKTIIIITVIILALIIGIISMVLITQSIIPKANKMDCVDRGENKVTCSMVGLGSAEGSGDKINFRINNPSRGDDRRTLLLQKALYVNSDLREFIDTHHVIDWDVTQLGSYNSYEPYDDQWDERLPGIATHQYFSHFAWSLTYPTITNILKEQFIIINGTSESGDNFKSYGLCDFNARSCWIYDPFPDNSIKINPSSIVIYFKDNGYKEEDACIEFNIGCKPKICTEGEKQCQKEDLFICEDNQFILSEECEFGCEDAQCKSKPHPNYILYIAIGIVAIFIIGGLLYIIMGRK